MKHTDPRPDAPAATFRPLGYDRRPMRIVVASDHAGFPLKEPILELVRAAGHEAVDMGTTDTTPVDYPDVIAPAAFAVAAGEAELVNVLGGSGTGEQIVANKVPGIRAALTHDTYSATRAALSNNAQIITMGSRVIGVELAKDIAGAFLRETFDEKGRSADNVRAINEVDAKYNRC